MIYILLKIVPFLLGVSSLAHRLQHIVDGKLVDKTSDL